MSLKNDLQNIYNVKNDIKNAIINQGQTVTDDFTTYSNAISNISSTPDGIFIQEETPTKTTDEAVWLKEGDIDTPIFSLNDLPENVLAWQSSQYADTVSTLVERLSPEQKNIFNNCTYHIIGYIQPGNVFLLCSDFPFYGNGVVSDDNPPYVRIGTTGTCYYTNHSFTMQTFSAVDNLTSFYYTMDYVSDITMKSDNTLGNIVVLNNYASVVGVNTETGIHIDVDGTRYVVHTNKSNSWDKILDTSDANANASDILTGKTAYKNNTKITGTMNNLGDLNIIPNTSGGTINSGFVNSINISAVNASIDSNITAENIANGVNILGVVGTLDGGSINLTNLDIIPSTSSQSIVPSSPIDGYNIINISGVDSTIDSNISAVNIKQGVNILGVTGTYEGSNAISINNVIAKSNDLKNYLNMTSVVYVQENFVNTLFNVDSDVLPEIDITNISKCSRMFMGLNNGYPALVLNFNNTKDYQVNDMLYYANLSSVTIKNLNNTFNISSMCQYTDATTIYIKSDFSNVSYAVNSFRSDDICRIYGQINLYNAINIKGIFADTSLIGNCNNLFINAGNGGKLLDASEAFAYSNKLTFINNINKINTLVNIAEMCKNCTSLQYVPLYGPSSYNLVNCKNMSNAFAYCTSMNFYSNYYYTNNCENMADAFILCRNLRNVSMNTSNCKNMHQTFYGCSNLYQAGTIDLNNISNAAYTFYNCTSLYNVDIKNAKYGIESMKWMFYNCNSLSPYALNNLANNLPNASDIVGEYVDSLNYFGLNVNKFSNAQKAKLYNKGYMDCFVLNNTDNIKPEYTIQYDLINEN